MSKDDVQHRDEGLPESHGSGCSTLMFGLLALLIALTFALARCGNLPRYFSKEPAPGGVQIIAMPPLTWSVWPVT